MAAEVNLNYLSSANTAARGDILPAHTLQSIEAAHGSPIEGIGDSYGTTTDPNHTILRTNINCLNIPFIERMLGIHNIK